MISILSSLLLFEILIIIIIPTNSYFTGFNQQDEYPYKQRWSEISKYSYEVPLPIQLSQSCKANKTGITPAYANLKEVELTGNFHAADFQSQCGNTNLCVLTQNSTLVIDANLNVAALAIRGTVYWNETTQSMPTQWICAGFIVVEDNGTFQLSLDSLSNTAFIYIKNNGALHSALRSRVFGGYNPSGSGMIPTIDVTGRKLRRTWSLLSKPILTGANVLQLIHNPIEMGWRVGDRILISPTTRQSTGYAETYFIQSFNAINNSIYLDSVTKQPFSAIFQRNGTQPQIAIMSAEVINLSRNVIITGDDFNEIACDRTLLQPFSETGCSCNPSINRTSCTMGLHTIMAGKGTMKIQHSRIEKCGQRGVMSKYCLHFHRMGKSLDSVFRGNAIENSQQRGIVIHGTQAATIEDNVLSDVRGTGIFIQDGTEMYNKVQYNVVVCPTPKASVYGGCSVPGTDNGQSDAQLNQAGLWSMSGSNYLIGNRFANSYNGMFYDLNKNTNQLNPLNQILGKVLGNTFHGHGRFGTNVLEYYPQKHCIADMDNSRGYLAPGTVCSPFTSTGADNGASVVLSNNIDYDNLFVGGYNYGDVQYYQHMAIKNSNNVYWKETKNFADGCSAHISNSYYADGNIALPDSAAFIIENSVFTGFTTFETNHHCNEGPTGFLCMPTYVMLNVSVHAMSSKTWVQWHINGNHYGGIITLAPPEQANPTGAGGFFPPGYNSLVSFYWSYLLQIDNTTCKRSIDIHDAWIGTPETVLDARYSSGILCKKPVRSLKIYTRGLSKATASNMTLEIWQNNTKLSSFQIRYHQIGTDLAKGKTQNKQGYAFPVIADTAYEYRLSMTDNSKYRGGALPWDWVVEFSDPVFGNRWSPDQIVLTVRGRECDSKLVSSQHDRRWVWSDTSSFPNGNMWGRGACNSSYPDMPTVRCPAVPELVPTPACEGSTTAPLCQNGYFDCGSKQCVCEPGYSGDQCSVNICDAARCGQHGKCIATYLGGTLLPTLGACVCDQGWSGPNCDQNPCNGVTCSGRGYCQAKGDTDYQCICDTQYFGAQCEKVKVNACALCPPNFMDVCGNGLDNKLFVCRYGKGPNVGCGYFKSYTAPAPSTCCYSNCEKCSFVTCPAARNDCHLSGACKESDRTCGPETRRSDGSPCNSVPYGICSAGVCQPNNATALSTLSISPVISPTFALPAKPSLQPSNIPSNLRASTSSFKPTTTPSVNTTSNQPITMSPSSVITTYPTFTPTIRPNMLVPIFAPIFASSLVPTVVHSFSPSNFPVPNAAAKYIYLGCYGDYFPRAIPLKVGVAKSIAECFGLAAARNYTVFGLQYGGECWVSNNITNAKGYGSCDTCTSCGKPKCNCANIKCASGENCGDGWANALYRIPSH